MPEVTIVYWRDIPAQVIVGKGRTGSKVKLHERFEQAIDRCAMKIGAKDADAYLAEWRKAAPYPVEGEPAEVAAAEAVKIETEYDQDRLKLLINSEGWGVSPLKEAPMALFNFRRDAAPASVAPEVESFLEGYSIEVMPRTAEKVEDFRAILPKGTRVYIAHIEGTPIADMVATAKRIAGEGFDVMPHFPARIIHDKATLADWIARYQGEANVKQALLLGGGVSTPAGDFDSSMQILETGLFDGFTRLHVAGHPEGNKDIDRDGGDRIVLQALKWKQDFANRSDAKFAIATQFCFEATPVIAWADRLAAEGIHLPIHIGVAGPAKLQTLIKFAVSCGVGASLRVLQKRAMDVTKLLLPYEPTDFVADLAAHKARNPAFGIEQVHFFPLGGIKTNAAWVTENGGAAGVPASA